MKQGNIYYTDKDFTDIEVSINFKYPCMLILKNAENEIKKITTYNENGIKSIYDFSQSASKQFVTDSIATAFVGLEYNRLEFNNFSDFPAIGDETKLYIDLSEGKIYIWDSNSQTYKKQSWGSSTVGSYRVEIISTKGNFFKNDIIETTLIARVYFGAEDITDSLPQNSFRWKRVSDDSSSDNDWNLLHQDFGSNILNIDSDDVENRAVFNCEVNI